MSTFETVKRRLMRDIQQTPNMDGMQWANIMLKNTTRLTDEEEQKKFWNFIQNPGDVDLEETTKWDTIPEPTEVQQFVTAYDDDHKEVELENRFMQNGLCTFISTTNRTSGQKQLDLPCDSEEDEKVAI